MFRHYAERSQTNKSIRLQFNQPNHIENERFGFQCLCMRRFFWNSLFDPDVVSDDVSDTWDGLTHSFRLDRFDDVP